MIVFFILERFSRQPKDGERLIELAVDGLVVLDSESVDDLRTPNGKKAFGERDEEIVVDHSDR